MRILPTSSAPSAPSAKTQTKTEGDAFGDLLGDADATPATSELSRQSKATNAISPRVSKEASTQPEQPTSGTASDCAIQSGSDEAGSAGDGGGTPIVQKVVPHPAKLLVTDLQAESSCSSMLTRTMASGGQNPRTPSDTRAGKGTDGVSSGCPVGQPVAGALPSPPNPLVCAMPAADNTKGKNARGSLSLSPMLGLQANCESQMHDSGIAAKEPATTSRPDLENATGDAARAGSIAGTEEHAIASVPQGEINALPPSVNITATSSPPATSSAGPFSTLQTGAQTSTDPKISRDDSTDSNASTISSTTGKLADDKTTASTAPTSAPGWQASSTQLVPVQPKSFDVNTGPTQTPTLHGAVDDSAPKSLGETRSASDLLHASGSVESGTAYGINSARLIQAMGQTEMQVGMRSTDFGDISIRASISQQQMLAQISVSHSELSQAMMAHLASVQTKIGNDHGLQTSISLQHHGAATAGGGGQSSQREQQGWAPQNHVFSQSHQSSPEGPVQSVSSASVDAAYRLDIQA